MSIAESRQKYSCRPQAKAERNRLSESVYHCVCTEASEGLNFHVWTLCVCVSCFQPQTRGTLFPFNSGWHPLSLFSSYVFFFFFFYHPSFIFQMWDQGSSLSSDSSSCLPLDRLPEPADSGGDRRRCGNMAEDAAAHRTIDFSPPVSSVAQIWGISTESHIWDEVSLIATIYADGESPINNVMINHRHYFFFTWTRSNTLLMLPFKTWPHYIYHGFMCSLCIQVNRGWHIKMAF